MNEQIFIKVERINKKIGFLRKIICKLKINSNQTKYNKKIVFIENSLYKKNLTLEKIYLLRKKIVNLFLELRKIKNKDLRKYIIDYKIIKRELSIYSCFDDITDEVLLEKKFQEECLLRYNICCSRKAFYKYNDSIEDKIYKKYSTLLKNEKLENERRKDFNEKIKLDKYSDYSFLKKLNGDYYYYFYSILIAHFTNNKLSNLESFYHKTKTYDSIKDIINNSKDFIKNKYQIKDIEKFVNLLTNDKVENNFTENKLELEDLDKFIDFFLFKKRKKIQKEDIIKIFNFSDIHLNTEVEDVMKKYAYLSNKENLIIYFFNKYCGISSKDGNYDFEHDVESFLQIFDLFFDKYKIPTENNFKNSIINTLSSKKNYNELYIHNLDILRKRSKIFLEIDLNENLETLNKYVSDAKDHFLDLRKNNPLINELFNFPDYEKNVFSYLSNSSLSLDNKNALLGDLLFIFDCKSLGLPDTYITTRINYKNHNEHLPTRKSETIKKQYDIMCNIIFNKKFYKYSQYN